MSSINPIISMMSLLQMLSSISNSVASRNHQIRLYTRIVTYLTVLLTTRRDRHLVNEACDHTIQKTCPVQCSRLNGVSKATLNPNNRTSQRIDRVDDNSGSQMGKQKPLYIIVVIVTATAILIDDRRRRRPNRCDARRRRPQSNRHRMKNREYRAGNFPRAEEARVSRTRRSTWFYKCVAHMW